METGLKKLTEAVKRDCRKGQGCFTAQMVATMSLFGMCLKLTQSV